MAARKILTPYDFNRNEIQNVVAQNLASAPGTPVAGQFYYDTSSARFLWRNATVFIDALARANHTGTQLASTVSDFDTQVRTSTLNQMAAPTVDLSLNSKKITNLVDGTGAQDAATYGQLLSVQNGRDFKDSVRLATAAAGTLASSFANGSTVDGVVLQPAIASLSRIRQPVQRMVSTPSTALVLRRALPTPMHRRKSLPA